MILLYSNIGIFLGVIITILLRINLNDRAGTNKTYLIITIYIDFE